LYSIIKTYCYLNFYLIQIYSPEYRDSAWENRRLHKRSFCVCSCKIRWLLDHRGGCKELKLAAFLLRKACMASPAISRSSEPGEALRNAFKTYVMSGVGRASLPISACSCAAEGTPCSGQAFGVSSSRRGNVEKTIGGRSWPDNICARRRYDRGAVHILWRRGKGRKFAVIVSTLGSVPRQRDVRRD
jgi:hypothetical protein